MFLTLGWMLLAGLASPRHQPAHRFRPAFPVADGRVTLWTDREEPYPRGRRGARLPERGRAGVRLRVPGGYRRRMRVLFPREPWADNYVQTSQTFEVTGGRGGRSFIVDDYPGIGYLFAVASPDPLDFRDLTRGDYWDYRLIEGGRIQGDPYVTLTDLAASSGAERRLRLRCRPVLR